MTAVSPVDHQIAVTGGRVFIREWIAETCRFDACPIVLLHDSLGCAALWRDFPEHLAAVTRRRVIAYDRLGFGRSAPHPGELSPDFIEDEGQRVIPALLGTLGLDRVILYGHSVGGGMAIAAAAALANRCQALITEAAQVFAEPRTFEGIRAARGTFAQGAPAYERLYRYHGAKTDWVLRSWIDMWLDPGFADFNLKPVLEDLRCPVLALHGQQDEYGSTDHARAIAAAARGPVVLRLLQECGHTPHREQSAAVLDAIATFLGDVN